MSVDGSDRQTVINSTLPVISSTHEEKMASEVMNGSVLTQDVEYLRANIDDMFLLFNAIIISLMQVGFACLEAGCVNSKNVTNIIMKNVLDMFICALWYWLIGYSFAYSHGNPYLGYKNWAGVGVEENQMSHWFFQFIFAATAATILSGAVAERCNFIAYIAYSSVISGCIYPIVSHWAWAEEGWLLTLGYKDFAGSGVVHATAGACSLVAAIFIGPRIGRFENGVPVEKPGHSTPLTGIGGLLLISGFMAFNGGSLGHISHPGDGVIVARSITNTIMGGTGAAVIVLILCKIGLVGTPTWAFSITLNATLAGMVSVCAGVDVFSTIGALLSGVGACLVYVLLRFIVLKCKVDDPLDAVAVHLGGGLWGIISMPLFAQGGIIYGINTESTLQLLHNIIGGAAIIVWSTLTSICLFGLLRLSGCLRVTKEEELEGLDISKHNEPAYPVKGWHLPHPLHLHHHIESQKSINSVLTPSHFGTQQIIGKGYDNFSMEMESQHRR